MSKLFANIGAFFALLFSSVLGCGFVLLGLFSLPLTTITMMRIFGWDWWSALIGAVILGVFPILGQAVYFVFAIMGAYYFVNAGLDWRQAAYPTSNRTVELFLDSTDNGNRLKDLLLSKLDRWVLDGADIKKVQSEVVENCGKLIIISATTNERNSFSTTGREIFDFRVDVCVKMTVNRGHPQPEFNDPKIVKTICEEMPPIFEELCQRYELIKK